jgi:hypothetical protein
VFNDLCKVCIVGASSRVSLSLPHLNADSRLGIKFESHGVLASFDGVARDLVGSSSGDVEITCT